MAIRMRPTSPSMEILPTEILSNIFSRLSIKCLLRFKCVSKVWRSVITSRYFAALHLQRNLRSLERLLIFVGKNHSLYSVNLDSPELPAIKIPRTSRWEHFGRKKLVGSCYGLLLCICDENSDAEALLINPTTLPRKWVPKLQVPEKCLYLTYGFGYDFVRDDYKIVKITHFLCSVYDYKILGDLGREVLAVTVSVYSLITDTWKLVDGMFPVVGTPVSQNGAVLLSTHLLHWLFSGNSANEDRIVCFDVCREQWSTVPLPADLVGNECYESEDHVGHHKPVDLGVLDGYLSLVTRSSSRHIGHADVWVMKEYCVADSWVKLLDISDERIFDSLNIAPIAYSKEGGEILLRKDLFSRAFWYDLSEKTIRAAEFHGLPEYQQVSICIRSVVHLCNNGYCSSDS